MFNPLALAGIPTSIFKMAYGVPMKREGERLEESAVFTPYKTPDEINEALSIYDTQRLNQGLPGQGVIMDRIQGNAANTIQGINRYGGSGAEMIAGITGTNANTDAALMDLAIAAAQQQRQDESNYANMLQTKANYTDKEWEINKYLPYQQQLETARRMQEAGAENINQGLGDLMGAVSASFIPGLGGNKMQGTGLSKSNPRITSALNSQQVIGGPSIDDNVYAWKDTPEQEQVNNFVQQEQTGGNIYDILANLVNMSKGKFGRY